MDESNGRTGGQNAWRARPRIRQLLLALPWILTILSVAWSVRAVPAAHILRVDPRAASVDGAPILTVVVDVVQNNRLSQVVADCEMLAGDLRLDCEDRQITAPGAIFTPSPFPEKNASFVVRIDGTDRPAEFVRKGRWGESQDVAGVGTAWLILIDAAENMGLRLADAQATAESFLSAMKPNDIVRVMAFDGRQVVSDSRWLSASQVGTARSFVRGMTHYPAWGRSRPLSSIIRMAVNDAFHGLAHVPIGFKVPLHQALVVLSDGAAGTDPWSAGPGAMMLQRYLTGGTFPEDNTTSPKTPLPVVAVWFPRPQLEELFENAREFMMNLANPEIGGMYFPARTGSAPRIVDVVQDRFRHMHILTYRLPCIAPNTKQTFALVFHDAKPMIAGDVSFKDVAGIDPTTWPLDIDVQKTVEHARQRPIRPGEALRVYGNFCWGLDRSRPEAYFLRSNQPAPAEHTEIAPARKQLMATALRGKPTDASDSFADFEAPADADILVGKGDETFVRLLIVDHRTQRSSAVHAGNILELRAEPKAVVRAAPAQPGARGGRCGCRVAGSDRVRPSPELVLLLALGGMLWARRH